MRRVRTPSGKLKKQWIPPPKLLLCDLEDCTETTVSETSSDINFFPRLDEVMDGHSLQERDKEIRTLQARVAAFQQALQTFQQESLRLAQQQAQETYALEQQVSSQSCLIDELRDELLTEKKAHEQTKQELIELEARRTTATIDEMRNRLNQQRDENLRKKEWIQVGRIRLPFLLI